METNNQARRYTDRAVIISGQVCRYVCEPDADWTGDGWRDESQFFLELGGAPIATWIGEWVPPSVVLGVVDGHTAPVDLETGAPVVDDFGECEALGVPFSTIPDPEDLEVAP